jgi:hypothetical protein
MAEHRPKKLLGQVHDAIRLKHHRTQQAWTRCVERCIGSSANPPAEGAPSAEPQTYSTVHPALRKCFMTTPNWLASIFTPGK